MIIIKRLCNFGYVCLDGYRVLKKVSGYKKIKN